MRARAILSYSSRSREFAVEMVMRWVRLGSLKGLSEVYYFRVRDSNLRPYGPETCNLTVRLLRCDDIY